MPHIGVPTEVFLSGCIVTAGCLIMARYLDKAEVMNDFGFLACVMTFLQVFFLAAGIAGLLLGFRWLWS